MSLDIGNLEVRFELLSRRISMQLVTFVNKMTSETVMSAHRSILEKWFRHWRRIRERLWVFIFYMKDKLLLAPIQDLRDKTFIRSSLVATTLFINTWAYEGFFTVLFPWSHFPTPLLEPSSFKPSSNCFSFPTRLVWMKNKPSSSFFPEPTFEI